jgi:AraC family ethanolamine operon transcriptional activator
MTFQTSSNISSYSFCNPEEMEATYARQQDFHLVKLDSQPLQCDILRLNLDQAILEFRTLNNCLRIWGDKKTNNLVFEFILSPIRGTYLSHGFAITQDTLYGFDNNRGMDLVLPARLLMGTLIIKREVFQDCLQIMERCDLDDRFWDNNYIQSPVTFPPVQNYLRELYGLVKQRATFLQQSQISRLILEDYLPLLIEAIPSKKKQKPPQFLKRSQLVRQAEDYMLANLEQPITLKDLCKILNTSKTPLNYGFQEVFGLSPLAYLRVLRLHAAHKALKAADPQTTKIVGIAERFGFWHKGRFSQYYEKIFGELPSETLKK